MNISLLVWAQYLELIIYFPLLNTLRFGFQENWGQRRRKEGHNGASASLHTGVWNALVWEVGLFIRTWKFWFDQERILQMRTKS